MNYFPHPARNRVLKMQKNTFGSKTVSIKARFIRIFRGFVPLRDYAPSRTSVKDVQYESTFLTL